MKNFLFFCSLLIFFLFFMNASPKCNERILYINTSDFISEYSEKCLKSINSIRFKYSLPELTKDDGLKEKAYQYYFNLINNNSNSNFSNDNTTYCLFKQKLSVPGSSDTDLFTQTFSIDYKRILLNSSISKIGIYINANTDILFVVIALQ